MALISFWGGPDIERLPKRIGWDDCDDFYVPQRIIELNEYVESMLAKFASNLKLVCVK